MAKHTLVQNPSPPHGHFTPAVEFEHRSKTGELIAHYLPGVRYQIDHAEHLAAMLEHEAAGRVKIHGLTELGQHAKAALNAARGGKQ